VDVVYFTIWIAVVYLGFTIVQVPHAAWGGELSNDYFERTRIMSVRQMFTLLGLVGATALPALVLSREGAGAGDVLAGLSLMMAALLPLCALIAFVGAPEPQPARAEPFVSPWRAGRIALRNGPFRVIVAALFLGYVAETFRITITLFFARDVVGVQNIGLIYVYYFAIGLAAVPFWGWLAGRIGKHRALATAFAIVVMTNLATFTLGRGQEALFITIFMAKGFCFGALELLPAALVADAVDVDTARSRQRRQGLFFAFIGMSNKIGQAIGQGLSLILLSAVGFAASRGNGPQELLALRVLYGVFPALILAPAIVLIWRYRLTAQRHAQLRRAIARRDA
jgi:Na+/melibiose symporter-like transporter